MKDVILGEKRVNNSSLVRLVIVGHVDHGKSTLIGRMLVDTNSIPEGKVEAVKKYCRQRGKQFEYAYLLDALEEEQEQGVTIDITQIYFNTNKNNYIIIDAPGHKEFLKNMISGAAGADVALLLIDAEEGIREQTKRHGYLLSLLGIKKLIVVINKMDKVSYSKDRFEEIKDSFVSFLSGINLKDYTFVPISAVLGENVATISSRMPWYKGESILELLDSLSYPRERSRWPLRMPIQDVYKFDERRIIAGRVESGILASGDEIVLLPEGSTAYVNTLERWKNNSRKTASAGESIGITLKDHIFVERGQILADKNSLPYVGVVFSATIFWIGERPLTTGKIYSLKITTQEVTGEVYVINKVINAVTLEEETKEEAVANDIVEITIKTKKPVVFDLAAVIPETGRLVFMDGYEVVGGGIITSEGGLSGRDYKYRSLRSRYIGLSIDIVTSEERENRLRQKGLVVWFTGLPGSGKTTLARALERILFKEGKLVYLIEGENLRFGLSADLGFTDEERREQTRRLAEVANLFKQAGIITIVASISPFRKDRDYVRSMIGSNRFIEVFLNCPLDVCKKRDPHGIYTKAIKGEIKGVTGVDSPYEPPNNPDIVLETKKIEMGKMLAQITSVVQQRIMN